MYSLTLNFPTHAALAAAVAALANTSNERAAPDPKPSKDGGKGAAGAQPSPSPSPSPAAASPAAPAPAPKPPKYEETGIGDMLKTASTDAGKRAAAVALLNEFGAVKDGKPSGQHLKAEQYGDFKAKLQAILDKAPEEALG